MHADWLDGSNPATNNEQPENAETTEKPKLLEQEYMRWHKQLNQRSPAATKRMAQVGLLPRKLASLVEIPVCRTCMYGKAKRKAWQTKKTPSTATPTVIKEPRDCVSID